MSFRLIPNGGTVSTPSNVKIEFHKPVTVPTERLTAYARGYGTDPMKELFKAVLLRDRICRICRYRLSSVVDHRISRNKGGKDDMSNCWGLCKRCHDIKTYMCDGSFGQPLRACTDDIIKLIYLKSIGGHT